MKTTITIIALSVSSLLLLFPGSSRADLVFYEATDIGSSKAAEVGYFNAEFPSMTYVFLAKVDEDGLEGTDYGFNPDDVEDEINADQTSFDIEWDLTGAELWGVLVKSGNDTPTHTVYTVTDDQRTDSNGPQTIESSNGSGISHVTYIGKVSNNVPDGGATIALLGLSLLSFAGLKKRLSR